MNAIVIPIQRLAHGAGLPLPAYQSPGAAGLDLLAAIPADASVVIPAGGRATIPTGFALALPEGTEAQVRSRSGLAAHHGVIVLNSPGTIDSDYRGEVLVILANLGETPFTVKRGARIAQLVVAPVLHATLHDSATLQPTSRGSGGLGSTGVAGERE